VLNPIFTAPEPHGKLFPEFLATEVLPLVSHEFRVTGDFRQTAIGGSSYGAVAALYALLHRPDLFGLGLLESTSLQVGNGQMLRDITPLAIGPGRVSVGVGTGEMEGNEQFVHEHGMEVATVDKGFAQLSEQLAADLQAAALNHPAVVFVKQPGAKHEEKAWAERFPAAIKFLFPKVNSLPHQHSP
jgi:predicted alpha/beta superfamily hydrolase